MKTTALLRVCAISALFALALPGCGGPVFLPQPYEMKVLHFSSYGLDNDTVKWERKVNNRSGRGVLMEWVPEDHDMNPFDEMVAVQICFVDAKAGDVSILVGKQAHFMPVATRSFDMRNFVTAWEDRLRADFPDLKVESEMVLGNGDYQLVYSTNQGNLVSVTRLLHTDYGICLMSYNERIDTRNDARIEAWKVRIPRADFN
jgi:hypothetical protein